MMLHVGLSQLLLAHVALRLCIQKVQSSRTLMDRWEWVRALANITPCLLLQQQAHLIAGLLPSSALSTWPCVGEHQQQVSPLRTWLLGSSNTQMHLKRAHLDVAAARWDQLRASCLFCLMPAQAVVSSKGSSQQLSAQRPLTSIDTVQYTPYLHIPITIVIQDVHGSRSGSCCCS